VDDTTTRTRDPESTWATTAGRATSTVTGVPGVRPLRRIGATSWSGTVVGAARPEPLTTHNDANSTASVVDEVTCNRTRDDPTIDVPPSSGADGNVADCPCRMPNGPDPPAAPSAASAPAEPGMPVNAAGLPPGGEITCWGRFRSGITVRAIGATPPIPGYAGSCFVVMSLTPRPSPDVAIE